LPIPGLQQIGAAFPSRREESPVERLGLSRLVAFGRPYFRQSTRDKLFRALGLLLSALASLAATALLAELAAQMSIAIRQSSAWLVVSQLFVALRQEKILI
jgi:hypothetical protein